MDKPESLDFDYADLSSTDACQYWKRLFEEFFLALENSSSTCITNTERLNLLMQHVSISVYKNIFNCKTYQSTMEFFDGFFCEETKHNICPACINNYQPIPEERLE